jgi:hypothetical protein
VLPLSGGSQRCAGREFGQAPFGHDELQRVPSLDGNPPQSGEQTREFMAGSSGAVDEGSESQRAGGAMVTFSQEAETALEFETGEIIMAGRLTCLPRRHHPIAQPAQGVHPERGFEAVVEPREVADALPHRFGPDLDARARRRRVVAEQAASSAGCGA